MELVVNDLLNYENIKIVQSKEMFNFSLDSILLPNFVNLNKSVSKILDIGTGNAPIPLILYRKTTAKIDAVEIQKEVYELALKSIDMNNFSDRISVFNCDIRDFALKCESDTYDVITCNPPFFNTNQEGNFNKSSAKKIARHETQLNLEIIFMVAKKILKNKGKIAIVHRSDRLVDIIFKMRKHNIEPKKIMLVYPKHGKNSNIVLVEGSKNGGPGLTINDPLYVHEDDGSYSEQVKKYFGW